MDRLYDRLVYWLYERQDAKRARRVADALGKLLARFGADPESIFVEECRSLVCEAKGDLPNAIKHRENEIRLIRRLHEISQNTATKDFVLGQYDYRDLCDRLDLLAILYHDSGDLNRAIRTLEESKQLCANHELTFDSENVLREYLKEQPSATLYLRLSENGTFSVEQASTDIEEMMPTATSTRIEEPTHEAGRPITRVELQQLSPPANETGLLSLPAEPPLVPYL